MRIRFFPFEGDILTQKRRNLVYSGFEGGQIVCVSDEAAQEYIQENLAEVFNYSISDEEIRQLHEDFIKTSCFNKRVEILLYTYFKSVNKSILEDGTEIDFSITPETSSEWLHINTQLIEYYKKEVQETTIKGLIKCYDGKRFNSPDQKKVIDSELIRIKEIIQDDITNGLAFWYKETNDGNVPKDETGYKRFLSNPIRFGVDIFLRGVALAEYEAYLKSIIINEQRDVPETKELITTLPQLFISDLEYHEIMTILVKRNLCQENTFIWIDEKKGTLTVLASLIKHLHSKGYFKRRPTNDEVRLIAQNSFKIDIRIDTIKRAKINSYNFNFIPESR